MSPSETVNPQTPRSIELIPKRRWSALPVLTTGAVLVALWWLGSIFADALPGPGATGSELWSMALDGHLWSIFWRMTAFMTVCFAIALVLGVAGGLAMGAMPRLDRGLSPYLAALQGMPTSMWIPVAAIVLGTEVWSLGAVVALGAVPAIVLGTRNAVHNVPPVLLRAGRTLGESGVSLVRRVVLPAALPGIMVGVELGWSIAFRCLVAGELFSGALSGTGIGVVIANSRETGDLTQMMATIIIVLVFAVAVDRLVFARAQRKLRSSRGLVDSGLPH